jgi:hypothetical protein
MVSGISMLGSTIDQLILPEKTGESLAETVSQLEVVTVLTPASNKATKEFPARSISVYWAIALR